MMRNAPASESRARRRRTSVVRLRWALALAAVTIAALVAAVRAGAVEVIYAGPKTWGQGWEATGSWDYNPACWYFNVMENKSCGYQSNCWARVAFIDNVSYAWHCSVTGIADATGCAQFNDTYVKKPLCKNNSTIVYTAQCKVTT